MIGFRDDFCGKRKMISVYQGGDQQPFAAVQATAIHNRVPSEVALQFWQPDTEDPDPMPADGQEYAVCTSARHLKCSTKWVLVSGMVKDSSKARGYKTICKACAAESERLRERKWKR